MKPTLFDRLSDICNDLERAVRDVPDGPPRSELERLVTALDVLIDTTIGLDAPREEEA